jgi:hypothetical protein
MLLLIWDVKSQMMMHCPKKLADQSFSGGQIVLKNEDELSIWDGIKNPEL